MDELAGPTRPFPAMPGDERVADVIYWILGLAVLAGAAAWLGWRCVSLRRTLEKAEARCRDLQKERAQRQNLQHALERRGAEVRRLRAKVAEYESEFQEMENHANDLNMSLFQESGLRILAQKEEGANRLKLEQLEAQLSNAHQHLKAQQEQAQAQLKERDEQAREAEAKLREEIAARDKEIARLQTANARRIARKAQQDNGGLDQMTLDDLLMTTGKQ